MQKWEYMTWVVGYAATDELTTDEWQGGAVKYRNGVMRSDWKKSPKLPDALNQAGQEGWELVAFQYPKADEDPLFVFRRPLG